MPFRSEKQRRFLWAEHPEIAKRWAHEYPESNKGLPMYAKKTDKQEKAEKAAVLSVMKAAVSKIACLGDGSILGGNSDAVSKEANSGMVRVDMPNNEKPTYAGEEQEKGEAKPVENAGECSEAKKQDENAVTALFGKLSAVLARPLREAMEHEQALTEGREPLYVPQNLGVRQPPVTSPAVMPPMGMTPPPQQVAQTQPQQQGQAKPVGGGSNPQFNPINAFGAISSSGQINGNAAFGQKHSPGSSKIAAQNPALAALMGLAAETNVDPDELADTIDAALSKFAAANTPCSCGCGDTVATCKCGPSCKCRKPGGSCYKAEKKAGTPAWQRSEGKNDEGGLNEKGRKSYEREHGGDLKAPVTESNPSGERAKRQNSFCSRMCGMKRVNTGAKTKSDPDSRINKSLRKWNCKCSSAYEFGEKLASVGSALMRAGAKQIDAPQNDFAYTASADATQSTGPLPSSEHDDGNAALGLALMVGGGGLLVPHLLGKLRGAGPKHKKKSKEV